MKSFWETIVHIVDMLTEDKLVAMYCLTAICYWTIKAYPGDQSATTLPVITGSIGAIGGFVTGRIMAQKNGETK